MLEIVHDIAPGAGLYFHDCGENTIDFTNGVTALADAGCTVIVDDIGWITQPFFEDGSVATHIQSLASTRNLVYLSSAGNAGQRHYQGTYRSDGSGFHDFSGGTAPVYKHLYLRIPPGGSVRTVLEWDDPWTGSANDYDLYLVDRTTSNFIAASERPQDGDDAPLEFFSYQNTGTSTIEAEVDVYNYSAAARTLEVYIYPAGGALIYSKQPRRGRFGLRARRGSGRGRGRRDPCLRPGRGHDRAVLEPGAGHHSLSRRGSAAETRRRRDRRGRRHRRRGVLEPLLRDERVRPGGRGRRGARLERRTDDDRNPGADGPARLPGRPR
jgi:hypothetical protein